MVALGETFLVAYGLSLGIHERNAAIIGTLPVVFGSMCQMIVFRCAKSLVSARHWVVFCAAVQAIVLFCLPIAKMLGGYNYAFLILGASIYWAASFSAGPVWNGWVTSILPVERQKRFFYRRNAIAQLGILSGILAAGIILRQLQPSSFGYPTIFMLAGVFRLISCFYLSQQPDSTDYPFLRVSVIGERSIRMLHQPFVRAGLLFSFFTNYAAYISAPFFSPYMLKNLALGPTDYSILMAVSFFARSLSGHFLEKMLKVRQNQTVLKVGVIGVISLPYLWTLSDRYFFLVGLQVLSGFFWGCHELGMTMLLVEKIDKASRLRILSMTNLVAALGMASGCLSGWLIAGADTIPKETYHLLFAVSSLLRLIPVMFLLPFLHWADRWQSTLRNLRMPGSDETMLNSTLSENFQPVAMSYKISLQGENNG